jgi:hypothetical protein
MVTAGWTPSPDRNWVDMGRYTTGRVIRRALAAITATSIGVGMVTFGAGAVTNVSPLEPGDVVRDSQLRIDVAPGGVAYSRSSSTANYAYSSLLAAGSALGCRGDLTTAALGASGNASPRTTVTVTGPDGATILTAQSPARDTTIAGAIGGYQPLNPQPAPAATSYRGGLSPSTSNPTGTGYGATVDLAGRPAGTYTITTTTVNVVKTGLGACSVATPARAATSTGFGTTVVAGPVLETRTFEYRPWQQNFIDVLGHGSVRMNITPAESRVTVDGHTGPILAGYQNGYAIPDGSFFALPADPGACAADPLGCLPPTAVPCDPAAGCSPRIVTISYDPDGATTSPAIAGVFDLETKAFIANVRVDGVRRTLLSLGTDQDAQYHALLGQLTSAADGAGVDLAQLLATEVIATTGDSTTTFSLLNGLQISPAAGASGVHLASATTVQSGLILDIFSSLGGPACSANKGDSNPDTAPADRYVHGSDAGYTVERSDLLPDVPRAGPLGALVGGPVYHITGDFVGAAPVLVNTATAIIGADTAAGEPNGYPVWVSPFVSGIHAAAPRTMDFLGTATWSASETPITGLGCLTVDFLLGAGVAIYNSPLDATLGTLPIWAPSPEAAAVVDQLDAAIADAAGQATADPTVAALLEQITALLPAVDGVPV